MSLLDMQNKHRQKNHAYIECREDFNTSMNKVTTEEEVKFLYIKELKLSIDMSNRNDLRVKNCLFEFKFDKKMTKKSELAKIVAQSLYYVKNDKNKALSISYIIICDKNEAIILEVEDFLYFLNAKYKWSLRPSSPDLQLIKDIESSSILYNYEIFDTTQEDKLDIFKSRLFHILCEE